MCWLLRGGGVTTNAFAQTVLPTIVVTGTPSTATTLPPVVVTAPAPGTAGPSPIYSGGGGVGGGGFFGGQSTESDRTPPSQSTVCIDIVRAGDDAKCDLRAPPRPEVNGCGSSGLGSLVPDYVVDWKGVGNIFTPACNLHDSCYGTYGSDKHGCDRALRDDMVAACQRATQPDTTPLDAAIHAEFMQRCTAQADLYSSGLQSWLVEVFVSDPAFNAAQDEGFCRYLSSDAEANQCL